MTQSDKRLSEELYSFFGSGVCHVVSIPVLWCYRALIDHCLRGMSFDFGELD